MKRYLMAAGVLLAISGPIALAGDGAVRHEGFEGFSEGTLGDAGANLYVSKTGRIQVINQ